MDATTRSSARFEHVVRSVRRGLTLRLVGMTAWRPPRQATREVLAFVVGTALIGIVLWGADEVGARLAS